MTTETQRLREGPAWRLFVIHAGDCDGTHAYVVSGQSQKEAENEVLDVLRTGDDRPELESCQFIGFTDQHTFQTIGIIKP